MNKAIFRNGNNVGTVYSSDSRRLVGAAREFNTYKNLIGVNGIGLVLAPMWGLLEILSISELADNLDPFVTDKLTKESITSSLLIVTASIMETAGFYKTFREKGAWTSEFKINRYIRFGGVLTAMAGIMDAIQTWDKSKIALEEGDETSGKLYRRSARASVAGSVLIAASLFVGPLALGFFLFGFAFTIAGSVLSSYADDARTKPIEAWLRRTCFGKPINIDKPWLVDQEADLDEAINEYYIITSGLQIQLRIERSLDYFFNDTKTNYPNVSHKHSGYNCILEVFLPDFNANHSKVNIELTIIKTIILDNLEKKPDVQVKEMTEKEVIALPSLVEKEVPGKLIRQTWYTDLSAEEALLVLEYTPNPGNSSPMRKELEIKIGDS